VPVKDSILGRPGDDLAHAGAALLYSDRVPIASLGGQTGSLLDRSAMICARRVSATFWLGLLLLYVFHFWLGWLPTAGLPQDQSVLQSVVEGYCPAVVLARAPRPFYSRMTPWEPHRDDGEIHPTARAKGLREKVSTVTGLRRAHPDRDDVRWTSHLLGGITESVFQLLVGPVRDQLPT
jgi:hypothetical protein